MINQSHFDAGKDWRQKEKRWQRMRRLDATGCPIQWTWTWATSRRGWGTGRPGMPQPMGSQSPRGHDSAIGQQPPLLCSALFQMSHLLPHVGHTSLKATISSLSSLTISSNDGPGSLTFLNPPAIFTPLCLLTPACSTLLSNLCLLTSLFLSPLCYFHAPPSQWLFSSLKVSAPGSHLLSLSTQSSFLMPLTWTYNLEASRFLDLLIPKDSLLSFQFNLSLLCHTLSSSELQK